MSPYRWHMLRAAAWEEPASALLSVNQPRSEFQEREPDAPPRGTEIHFPSQGSKNPSRPVFRAPCKTNLFSHVFAWWCGRISKWKATNLVPVNKHQNDVPLSRHASKTQSWVYFKNKIITIQIKTRQVNTKITHWVASSSWPAERKASSDATMWNLPEAWLIFPTECSFKIPITEAECQPGIKLWPLSQRQLTTQLVSGPLNLQSWIPACWPCADTYEQHYRHRIPLIRGSQSAHRALWRPSRPSKATARLGGDARTENSVIVILQLVSWTTPAPWPQQGSTMASIPGEDK